MSPSSLRFASLLLVGALSASALDLSGTVRSLDGAAKAGVKVVLASTGDSALTDVAGRWLLGSGSTPASRRIPSTMPGGPLAVRAGRLSLSYQGMDVAGRSLPYQAFSSTDGRIPRAARTASVPDTLVYSFQGKVFLRDTVSASRSGLVRVFDSTWNAAITYGYLTDARDGRTYRTVRIGGRTWMAQNLNYRNTTGSGDSVGLCYENDADTCSWYGRLYTWAEAMGASSTYDTTSLAPTLPRKGICPEGWHVPSDSEWQSLEVAVGMSTTMAASIGLHGTTEGTKLKSTSGWSPLMLAKGTDLHGFRVLPTGILDRGTFISKGYGTRFWTASEYYGTTAFGREVDYGSAAINYTNFLKTNSYSLRCRQD